jgi:hypothetical protein
MNSFPPAQERRIQSQSHEEEMIEKYSAIHGLDKAHDFHYWWQEVKYESGNKVTLGYHRDFPMPYSNYYLQHFIETYFAKGSENNLIFNLENHFIGDEIDAEYIETLFISVKDLGLFTPRAILIFNDGAGGMTTYAPPADGLEYINVASAQNVSSSSVFEGSELNLERAEIIRRWLKRRANELTSNNSVKNPTGRTLSPSTKQLAPALIEKEGRFFILCLEGELETTKEEINQRSQVLDYWQEYSQTYMRLYGHQKWTLSQVPKDAKINVNIQLFFSKVRAFFQKQYDKGETLWTSYKMCEIGISTAKQDLSIPYNNKPFNKAMLNGWTAAKEFLDLFHKRGAFDETPPFIVSAPLPKGTPISDVRSYFPSVVSIHGIVPTDANALQQLAVWLLHWAERHEPEGAEYSLAGQLREQQAAHPKASKFIKACHRLHQALMPLAASEQATKALLGVEYDSHSRNNLLAVLNWWAGWIREQDEINKDAAGAYLSTLRRVPIVEEWENGSPRHTLPAYLLDVEGFTLEITPLRQAFEADLLNLSAEKKLSLRYGLNELMSIDLAEVQRHREQFERGEYGLDTLLADYPALRFDVAGQLGGFKWQWVGPLFWSGLRVLLQYKQAAARVAYKQLSAALPDTGHPAKILTSSPVPAASILQSTDSSVTLFDKLCGGFRPEDLMKLIGPEGLGLYDFNKKSQADTATSTNWAELYWALKYKGLLPDGLSGGKADELLKATFGARSSKTRINATKPDFSIKPAVGSYFARIIELIDRI